MVNLPYSSAPVIEIVVALPKLWWITACWRIYASPIFHWQADTALWLIAVHLETSIHCGWSAKYLQIVAIACLSCFVGIFALVLYLVSNNRMISRRMSSKQNALSLQFHQVSKSSKMLNQLSRKVLGHEPTGLGWPKDQQAIWLMGRICGQRLASPAALLSGKANVGTNGIFQRFFETTTTTRRGPLLRGCTGDWL